LTPQTPTGKSSPTGRPLHVLPYMTLAEKALGESGMPLSTNAIIDYIAAHRTIGNGNDPKKARIVVQSSLSKDAPLAISMSPP